MPTRRGWALFGGSLALGVGGRLLGVFDLFALAAASFALAVAGLVYVRMTRFRLEAVRELRPARVHAGSPSRVELSVRNVAPTRSPVLTARDPFDGGKRWARFLLAPLGPGETARAAYRLPTDERGIYDLGPLQLALSDPFGVAAAAFPAAAATKLTVYPRTDRIAPLPLSRGNDPHAGADHPTALSLAGEDFYALRQYEDGDDPRRVHWGATAKMDELMVRQDEMPWQGRATVLLDVRRGVHTPASLELAVSAAASIVSACWERRSLVRLVTTSGFDSGFAAGARHVEAILEHLAVVQTERGTHVLPVLARLGRQASGGSMAMVTTSAATDADLGGVARLSERYGFVALVLFERSAFDPTTAGQQLAPRSVPSLGTVVRVTGLRPFAAAWEQAIVPSYGSGRPTRPVPRVARR